MLCVCVCVCVSSFEHGPYEVAGDEELRNVSYGNDKSVYSVLFRQPNAQYQLYVHITGVCDIFQCKCTIFRVNNNFNSFYICYTRSRR